MALSNWDRVQREKEKKRERIIQSAIELFTKNGFEKTTIDGIARKAKVGKGTFYYFFEKKEDVLLFYSDRENKRSHEEFTQKIGTVQNFFERLELLIDTFIKHAFHNKQFTKILIKERIVNVGKNEKGVASEWIKSIRELIDQARKENTFENGVDTKSIVDIINSICILHILYYLAGTIKTKKEYTAQTMNVLRIAFKGILSESNVDTKSV